METYTLNEMEQAFIDSYTRYVAIGNCEDVLYFLANKNSAIPLVADQTYAWSTIEDAWLMWLDAIKYAKQPI